MLRPGTRIGDFTLVRPLGRGGFADVWSARSPRYEEDVALKILTRAEDPPGRRGPRIVDRFLNEAALLTKLDHPGVVRIHELVRTDRGPAAFAMEKLEGVAMATIQDHLEPAQILDVLRQTSEALAYLHRQDILHRDVKAANIIIMPAASSAEAWQVKLIDFGLAKHEGASALATGRGMLVGTLRCLAPECIVRLSGADVELTHAVDQWGIGVALYRALSGGFPFRDQTLLELVRSIRQRPVPKLDLRFGDQTAVVQGELDRLLSRLLAKRPRDRFESMDHVVEALRGLEGLLVGQHTLTSLPRALIDSALSTDPGRAASPAETQSTLSKVTVDVPIVEGDPILEPPTQEGELPTMRDALREALLRPLPEVARVRAPSPPPPSPSVGLAGRTPRPEVVVEPIVGGLASLESETDELSRPDVPMAGAARAAPTPPPRGPPSRYEARAATLARALETSAAYGSAGLPLHVWMLVLFSVALASFAVGHVVAP